MVQHFSNSGRSCQQSTEMNDWSNKAVMIGDRWIQVRDGTHCEGDVSFELGGGATMIATVSAVKAVKIVRQAEPQSLVPYTPWGSK